MGFGGFARIIGGAMEGVGGAMVDQAKAEREAALKMIEASQGEMLKEQGMGVSHGYQSQENTQQNRAAMDRVNAQETGANSRNASANQTQRDVAGMRESGDNSREIMREKNDNSQVSGYQTDNNNEIIGFDRTGKPVKTGVNQGGLNKKDKELLDTLTPIYTKKVTTTDENDNKTNSVQVDAAGMAQRLNDMGRPDLAKMYGGAKPLPPRDGTNSTGSPNYDAGGGQPAPKLPTGMTPQQAIQQARQAIQSGKDPQAVKSRLQAMGIDPSGL